MKKINEFLFLKNSKIHNKGIYAIDNIKKYTKLIQYIGKKISKKQGTILAKKQENKAKKNNKYGQVYIFELNKKYDINGDVKNNYAKYINHSCNPNCKYKIENNKIWIVSIKNIKKGEEITYDYDYDLEDYKNHICRCNSDNCTGYIIGKKYRKILTKKLKSINK